MIAPVPPCPHHSAAPRLCPDCREERLTGNPPTAVSGALADAEDSGRVVQLGIIDNTAILTADLQRFLGRIRHVALTWEDAAALLRAAHRNGRLAAGVAVRASEALAEAFSAEPGLLDEANAVPTEPPASDHGEVIKRAFTKPTTG